MKVQSSIYKARKLPEYLFYNTTKHSANLKSPRDVYGLWHILNLKTGKLAGDFVVSSNALRDFKYTGDATVGALKYVLQGSYERLLKCHTLTIESKFMTDEAAKPFTQFLKSLSKKFDRPFSFIGLDKSEAKLCAESLDGGFRVVPFYPTKNPMHLDSTLRQAAEKGDVKRIGSIVSRHTPTFMYYENVPTANINCG